jgi:hypothetical protein
MKKSVLGNETKDFATKMMGGELTEVSIGHDSETEVLRMIMMLMPLPEMRETSGSNSNSETSFLSVRPNAEIFSSNWLLQVLPVLFTVNYSCGFEQVNSPKTNKSTNLCNNYWPIVNYHFSVNVMCLHTLWL